MSDRDSDSVGAVAREAIRLYFDPLARVRAWFIRDREIETSVAYLPRRHVRRVEDRRSYSFAVAFGLVALVAIIVAAASMFRLHRAEQFLQSRGDTYAIDLQARPDAFAGTFVITGTIEKPRATLASVSPTPIPEMVKELSTSRLVPIPFVRANSLDGKWVALDSVEVASNGTIKVAVPASMVCSTDCQVAVLLLPEGSIRSGEQSLALPPASAASRILSLRAPSPH